MNPHAQAAAEAAGIRLPPTFTINDSDGNPHTYTVTPHPANEGDKLAWRVQSLGVQPLLEAVKSLASTPDVARIGQAMQGGVDADSPQAVMADAAGGVLQAIGDVDVTPLAESLSKVMGHPDLPALARQIMKYAVRDGVKIAGDAEWAKAYQANYGEMMQAVGRVIVINDFFPVAQLFSGSSATTPAG